MRWEGRDGGAGRRARGGWHHISVSWVMLRSVVCSRFNCTILAASESFWYSGLSFTVWAGVFGLVRYGSVWVGGVRDVPCAGHSKMKVGGARGGGGKSAERWWWEECGVAVVGSAGRQWEACGEAVEWWSWRSEWERQHDEKRREALAGEGEVWRALFGDVDDLLESGHTERHVL